MPHVKIASCEVYCYLETKYIGLLQKTLDVTGSGSIASQTWERNFDMLNET